MGKLCKNYNLELTNVSHNFPRVNDLDTSTCCKAVSSYWDDIT